jgi:hypothetical protein
MCPRGGLNISRAFHPSRRCLGVGRQTINNDLGGDQNWPPDEVVPVTGLDGKNYTVPTVRPLALSAAAGLIARLFTPSAHLVYATPIVEFFLDQTKYRYKRL